VLARGISKTQSSEKNVMIRSGSCALKAAHSRHGVDRAMRHRRRAARTRYRPEPDVARNANGV